MCNVYRWWCKNILHSGSFFAMTYIYSQEKKILIYRLKKQKQNLPEFKKGSTAKITHEVINKVINIDKILPSDFITHTGNDHSRFHD